MRSIAQTGGSNIKKILDLARIWLLRIWINPCRALVLFFACPKQSCVQWGESYLTFVWHYSETYYIIWIFFSPSERVATWLPQDDWWGFSIPVCQPGSHRFDSAWQSSNCLSMSVFHWWHVLRCVKCSLKCWVNMVKDQVGCCSASHISLNWLSLYSFPCSIKEQPLSELCWFVVKHI